MKKVLSFFPAYGQFGVWDKEDPDAYPLYETGNEKVIKGEKGILLSVIPNREIEIIVIDNLSEKEKAELNNESHIINVGSKGVLVGGVETDREVLISPGKRNISIFFKGEMDKAKTYFVMIE